MDLTKEQAQREEFCKILFELAKNQEMLQDKSTRHAMINVLKHFIILLIRKIGIGTSIQIYSLC